MINLLMRLAVANPFPDVPADAGGIQNILSIVLAVVAAVTVIFIIINAIRYSTSLGDPQATAKIRDSIVYAAIGLIVVLTAETIVTVVIGKL